MVNEVVSNGVMLVRTPTGIGVNWSTYSPPITDRPIKVEVDYGGRRLTEELLNPLRLPWRDFYQGRDMMKCVVRVKDGNTVLAELPAPPEEDGILPFMRLAGEQVHVTENFVSVPPALTVTDERGAVWTLGSVTAPKSQWPDGEFAFSVLRNGVDVHEFGSRIERRGGRIRIFTASGWKVWSYDDSFFF